MHEIKAPISTIALLCENGKTADIPNAQQTQVPAPNMPDFLQIQELRSSEDISLDRITSVMNRIFRDIRLENRKIENYVDMVLYHARSEEVYKDYLIKETDLQEMIYEALEKERLLFIKSHVRAEVSCHETVYTDKKWCVFILSQLILNSIKYRAEMPLLRFYTSRGNNQITLTIEDNGKGIPAEDLPRIFEKGFTGRNGRSQEKATGMGLYLCKIGRASCRERV